VCTEWSARRSWRLKLDAAGVGSGDEDGLDALVAEASQQSLEQGLVDRADDFEGSAGEGVERAVAHPEGVLAPTVGLVAVPLERVDRGGEGALGAKPPKRSGMA
jgi:hypothetical protein